MRTSGSALRTPRSRSDLACSSLAPISPGNGGSSGTRHPPARSDGCVDRAPRAQATDEHAERQQQPPTARRRTHDRKGRPPVHRLLVFGTPSEGALTLPGESGHRTLGRAAFAIRAATTDASASRSTASIGRPIDVNRIPDWMRPCWRTTASTYARTCWTPTPMLRTRRYAVALGETDGNGTRFADRTVIFCPGAAESRTMSARQVVVCAALPLRHDAFASRSVRYTCAVEPTVTNSAPCSKWKSGDAASPVTVRSLSSRAPHRAPFGRPSCAPRLRREPGAQVDALEDDRARGLLACLRQGLARLAVGGRRRGRDQSEDPDRDDERTHRPTVLSASHRGSYARLGRSQRSTTARSSPFRSA